MAQQKANYSADTRLTDLIGAARRAFNKAGTQLHFAVFFLSTGILLGAIFLTSLAEHFFYLPAAVKIICYLLSAGLSAAAGLLFYRKQHSPDFQSFYHSFSERADVPAIRHAFDLKLFERSPNLRLYQAALDQNIASISVEDFSARLKKYTRLRSEHRAMKRFSGLFAFTLACVLCFGLLYPASLSRSLRAWKSYQPPNPYSYTVEPGTVTLEQGNAFTPAITFEGSRPEQLSLSFKTDIEEDYRNRPAEYSESQKIRFAPINLNTNGSYYFTMDGYRSPAFRVNVQLLPRFESLSVIVTPPSYTGLDSSSYQYPFSKIPAYQGSKITISGIANKKLHTAQLLSTARKDTTGMEPGNDNRFSFTSAVTASDTLSFTLQDTSGLVNKNRFEFIVEPVKDQYPFAELIKPEQDMEMKNPEALPVIYQASDDFGLSAARLHYELQRAFKDKAEKGSKPIAIPKPNKETAYNWDIKKLNPRPRDVLTFWIAVADNDAFNGPKTSRSRTLTITFPSLTAYLDKLEDQESDVQQSLESISDSHERMQQEYEQFKEKLRQNPEGDWEQKQSLEEVKKQQKEIDKKVDELNKKFEAIRKEMKKNDLVSEETMKAYDELKKLMEQINDPELAKALEELQKALGNVNQQQLRNALQNYEFNEEQYKERLQRTVELFKMLKLNSDLEKMARALEDLSKQEQELSEKDTSLKDRLEEQRAIQKDTDELSKKADSLSANPPKRVEEQIKRLQNEVKEQFNSVKDSLQHNMQQMRNGPQPQLKQQQQQISKTFKDMAKKMRNAKQQLGSQQKQINIAALQYVLYSLIELSKNQEELSRETGELASRSQAFVGKARAQQVARDYFSQLADSLYRLSEEIPALSNRINEKKAEVSTQLEQAVAQLAERNKEKSAYAQRQSLGGINTLASMVASLLEQLQNQQQGGGAGSMTVQQLIEQMKKMGGQQQMLNKQLQQMINDMQGDRLSNDQIERLKQMARQQNKIRKQLRELQQKGGMEAGDKVLSELQRMSEQMEEAINDLRGGQTDPIVVKRQQNILSRMLNAEKALQERGEEKKRESTTARQTPRAAPPDITLEELQKKIRALLNDPEQTKFNEDYQKLIRQYFELLQKMQQKDGNNF